MSRASLARSGSDVLRSRWGRTMMVVERGWEAERRIAQGLLSDSDAPAVLSRMNKIVKEGRFDVEAKSGRCWQHHLVVGGVKYSALLYAVRSEMLIVLHGWSRPGAPTLEGHATIRRILTFTDPKNADCAAGVNRQYVLHEGGLRITRCGGKWLTAAREVMAEWLDLTLKGEIKGVWHWSEPADWVDFAGVYRAYAPLRAQEMAKRRAGRALRRLAAGKESGSCRL